MPDYRSDLRPRESPEGGPAVGDRPLGSPVPRAPDPRLDDRSLGDLFSELSSEASTLIRQEIALAKVELREEARAMGRNVGMTAAGGAVAYAGLLILLAGLALLLGTAISDWLAFVIVGLIVAGVGYAVAQKGLTALKEANPAPERTIQTLKEDKEWLKNEMT